MDLKDVIPTNEIKARVGGSIKVLELSGLGRMPRIGRLEGENVHGSALNIWNRIVQNRLKPVNPLALGPRIDGSDPLIYEEIEKLIGEPVITDAAYFSAMQGGTIIAKVILFRVFPNNLHLCDVYFQNPAEPLPPQEQKWDRKCKGYGILPILIKNMKDYAREHGIEYLTLTAAFADVVPLFEKHGFSVEDNAMGRSCIQTKRCIPMELRIAP